MDYRLTGNMASTTDRISENIATLVRDTRQGKRRRKAARQLLAMLGWGLPPGVDDIGLVALDVSSVRHGSIPSSNCAATRTPSGAHAGAVAE